MRRLRLWLNWSHDSLEALICKPGTKGSPALRRLLSAGETARRILNLYEDLPPRWPPLNWRAPPPAGYIDAQGMRRISEDPWRPVRLLLN